VSRTAPIRWAALTFALAAAVGLSAYWTALASRPVEVDPPESAPQPVPRLFSLAKAPEVSPAVRDRAYRRGRRAGFREGRRAERRRQRRRDKRGFARWEPGAAYVVTGAADGRDLATRIGPLRPGQRYQLCRDGRRVCVTRPD
jgi:hypothetical protein